MKNSYAITAATVDADKRVATLTLSCGHTKDVVTPHWMRMPNDGRIYLGAQSECDTCPPSPSGNYGNNR